jgi:hypothetical protein
MGPWAYTIRAFPGGKHPTRPGLVNHPCMITTHMTKTSRDIEIAAYRDRMARNEISHIEVLDHDKANTETLYR